MLLLTLGIRVVIGLIEVTSGVYGLKIDAGASIRVWLATHFFLELST